MTSSTNPAPLTRDSILSFLRAVDAELAATEPDGQQHVLVLAGGAVMAILDLRATTLDIDSATRLDPAIKAAADRVAAREGLDKTVLNDAGSAWQPATLDVDACPVILGGQRLTVRQVPIDLLFIMKLEANRPHTMDKADLAALGPLVSYRSAADIQAAYNAAYPHTPDPYIGQHGWAHYVEQHR